LQLIFILLVTEDTSPGAGAAPIFQESGLLTDENGFIKVSQTLVSKSSNNIFGVGDCCSIEGYEWIPKAGTLSAVSQLATKAQISSDFS